MNTVHRNIALFILVPSLLLSACGVGPAAPAATVAPTLTATPEPTEPPTVTPTPAPVATIETDNGVIAVTKVEISPTFPPGCNPGDLSCSEASPGYVILILWLKNVEGDEPVDASGFLSMQIYLTGSDGSRTKIFASGLLNGESFVGFTPPESAGDFTLEWPGNPPLELGQ